MDYETIVNCFVGVFIDVQSNETKVFVISEFKDDRKEFFEFLKRNIDQKEYHISFNGLAFDSQITELILRNNDFLSCSLEEAVSFIYDSAQRVINNQDAGNFPLFWEGSLSIKQVDVYKLNHWDNPQKRSSLKWIQYSMDWYNIQDMPHHHADPIKTREELEEIIKYCINDVRSTKKIMELSSQQINLRADLTKEYGINLYSASEPRISKELFLLFLSKKLGIDKSYLKKLRTERNVINVSEILLPFIHFETPEFKGLYEAYKKLVINPKKIKGSFKYILKHKDVITEYGLGGIHGANKSGIYSSSDDMIIMTSDVTSFYPNLAIRNKWAPEHIDKKAFCDQYEWFFDERVKIPKENPKNYVYKIILNATYGLSLEENSFLYDPQLGMQITINGQLLLSMLYEKLSLGIPGCVPIMQNTDGLEMLIPKEHKETYLKICKEWEELTSLFLEHDEYQKIILPDVNNYLAVYKEKKAKDEKDLEKIKKSYPHYPIRSDESGNYYTPVKCKGRFEFDKLALHKNKSMLVIRKAVYNYFVNGIMPEEYLRSNTNIFDYCAGVKIKGNWKFIEYKVEKGNLVVRELQKTLRYYISNSGSKIVKVNLADGREIQVEAGNRMIKVFNVYEDKEMKEYDINYKYYLDQIYKEIYNIINQNQTPLTLF